MGKGDFELLILLCTEYSLMTPYSSKPQLTPKHFTVLTTAVYGPHYYKEQHTSARGKGMGLCGL